MITKDTYRQVQIAILSNIAEYKDKDKKEVWWEDRDWKNITIELIGCCKMILRRYYDDGNIMCIQVRNNNGELDGKHIGYYENGNICCKTNYKNGVEV